MDTNSEQDLPQADEQTLLETETREKWEHGRQSFYAYAVESGEPFSTFDDILEGQVRLARVTYQKKRSATELEDSFVQWDQLTPEDSDSLQELLESNPGEEEVHKFLESNPRFLVQLLAGGHGRYCISKKRLGADYVPDFLIAEENSMGIHWYAIELESPGARAYRQDGLQSAHLTHALGQIRDWRRWVSNNLDYARRPREHDGLGLIGIEPRITGVVIIGRRGIYPSKYNDFRREMVERERIVIHSYDALLEVAQDNRSGKLMWDLQ